MVTASIGISLGTPGILYAQERKGQRLHIVRDFGDRGVSARAPCGRSAEQWRLTINLPMGMCCKTCSRLNKD
jgi:hypothetical protein